MKMIDQNSACTTIMVGKNASNDGSMIYGRSDDSTALNAAKLCYYPSSDDGPTEFIALDSPFKCSLPKGRLAFSALERAALPYHWGEAGFNSLGVGMSSTESIFSSDEVLKIDPYVESGVAENSVFQITLPYIKTAREGVLRLGKLIEEFGSAEGFGVAFMDKDETWYLENAGGHRYLACKMKEDMYFVSGNQSRYRDYDPEDKDNYIASSDLIDFAIKNGFYSPEKDGKFDFHTAYSLECENDKMYNYPRVWDLQRRFTPSVKTDVKINNFPVYQKPDKKISIEDVKEAFRSHYNDTEHDPYLNYNPKEPYRPISIFRTINTHILQVRPDLPKEIGCVDYMAEGFADLSLFLPLYQGVTSYPKEYTIGEKKSEQGSAYWTFRKIATLGMVDYNKYAPVIKSRFAAFEKETSQKQKEMEIQYLKMYQDQPLMAKDFLQKFSDEILTNALRLAEDLIEELFTLLTIETEKEYKFHGA